MHLGRSLSIAAGILPLVLAAGEPAVAYAPSGYQIVTNSGVGPQNPTCPAGKKVLGGGVDSGAPLYGSRPEPPGNSWYASAGPGAFITAFAVCANVDATYEIVSQGGVGPQTPSCPATKRALGGGLDAANPIFGSRPDPSGGSWYASAGASAFITAYVICAEVDVTYQITTNSGVGPQDTTCLPPKVVTGGGADSDNVLYNISPQSSNMSFYASAGHAAFLTDYVICVGADGPPPIPDGGTVPGQPLAVSPTGTLSSGPIDVTWDATRCPYQAVDLYWGTFANKTAFTGGRCGLADNGEALVTVPDNVWFVMATTDGVSDGSWARNASGMEMSYSGAGAVCPNIALHITSSYCP